MADFRKIKRWLGTGFKIVLLTKDSFDEKKRWSFNRLGFIFFISLVFLVISAITMSLLFYTPLKDLVPGFTNEETQKISIKNAMRLDSLEHEITIRDQYITNMKQVLLGERPFNPELEINASSKDTQYKSDKNINFHSEINSNKNRPEKDLIYTKSTPSVVNLFPPVNGVVTNSFDPINDHYGTDIVSGNNETVHSTLNGTIILSNWTMETGYTVQIQHPKGFISVYRHLKKTNVKTGDKVKKGEVIGVYGNTGEVSYGPHLHFELWHNGSPLDPEKYLNL